MQPQGGTGERTYLVIASGVVKTPQDIVRDYVSSLSDTANTADYILIVHRALGWQAGGAPYTWLNSLKALREGQGLRVKVVDATDVYDEFTYGIVSPQAIKDFLTYAYASWARPAPQYVLLVGDGTNDPKNNQKLPAEGTYAYLPTYLAFTQNLGETATDDWFARVSGSDPIPDLYIGRLPASSEAQVSAMVGKILAYETTPNTRTWEKNVLFVADNEVNHYERVFEVMSDDAAARIPAGMGVPVKEYLADYATTPALTAAIKDRINNSGSLMVNYSGHGSIQVWADEHIFTNADVADLNNSSKLPFFVAMTCLNGYFVDPESFAFPSLAEALLRAASGGAVAVFMPTAMTAPEGQRILDTALFEAVFTRDIRTLGPAISAAKQTLLANGLEYEETSETFLLFGDPATRLKNPLPTAPLGLTAQVPAGGVSLGWQEATDCDGSGVAGYNVYRSTTSGGGYTKLNTALITGASFVDPNLQSGTWYYVVTSVDSDGAESVPSQEVSVTVGSRAVGTTTSGAGGGGGGCFINTMRD